MLFQAVAGSRPGELVLEGEIDMSVTDQLAALLAKAAEEGQPNLDLGGVTFMVSSGLNVLIQAACTRNGSAPIVVKKKSRGSRLTIISSRPRSIIVCD